MINTVAGEAVHDLNDLAHALANKESGDKVEVAYTRRGQHKATTVMLIPPR